MTATTQRPARVQAGWFAASIGSPRLLAGLGAADLRDERAHLAVHGPLPAVPLAPLLGLLDSAGLRGRGGAAFSLATKLRSLRRGATPVVVVNGAEGEPASGKDRLMLEHFPHLVLDGAALVAAAIGAPRIVVALSDVSIEDAVVRAAAARHDPRLVVRRVADRFVAGEARALIDALSGGSGVPPGRRVLPTERGLDGAPTLLSNVETFAQLAVLARLGPAAFAAVGTPLEPGTTLFSVTGALGRPTVVEAPLGTPLGAVGAIVGAGPASAVVGGYHGVWLPVDPALELSREGLRRVGGTLGAAAVSFVCSDTCALGELSRATSWLAAQSVGQCGPCAFGLPALAAGVQALVHGGDAEAVLRRQLAQVTGRGACAHPDGAVRFIASGLATLADEVAVHRRPGGCGRPVRGHLLLR